MPNNRSVSLPVGTGASRPSTPGLHHSTALRVIKLVHTVVWAFFASAIVVIPVLAWYGQFRWVSVAMTLVLVEVAVLVINGLRCPLTNIAARYTEDRRDNFDIYLPLWLATYNKQIFSILFVAGLVFAFICRVRR